MLVNLYSTNSKYLLIKSLTHRRIWTSAVIFANQKTYYDILGLKQDCSQKEIKHSFIELSRQHHPDLKESSCDKDFKKILEAYQVLSKPHSRANYDMSLRGIHTVNYVTEDIVHRPFEGEARRYKPVDPDSYYGIKGIRKVANWKIVLACLIFCATGVIAQVYAISKSFTFKREKLVEQSAMYNEIHKKTREKALSNSNMTNLENLLSRMKESPAEK